MSHEDHQPSRAIDVTQSPFESGTPRGTVSAAAHLLSGDGLHELG